MRLSRVQFTIRQFIVALAIIAPVLSVGRRWLNRKPSRPPMYTIDRFTVEPPAPPRFANPYDVDAPVPSERSGTFHPAR